LLIYQDMDLHISQAQFRGEIKKYLNGVVNKRHSKCHSLILTNEHCSSRLITKPEIMRLKNMLDDVCVQPKIFIYLRRQDDYIISLYNTYIKTGGKENLFAFLKNKHRAYRFNYGTIIQLWADVFGKENMIVRAFEKEKLKGENIAQDFLKSIGIDDFSGFVIPTNQNKSMDAKKLEFVRNLNFYFPHFIDHKINEERRVIIDLLNQLTSVGEKIPNNIVSLKAFYETFTESNKKIAREYLGLSELFMERESKALLPDNMLDEQLDVQQTFEIFSELWKLKDKK